MAHTGILSHNNTVRPGEQLGIFV